ncbi:neuraminidase-like domain-containing protein [Pseudomonas guariconensis]|uniref:Tc toxin subunit A-related protein n=1 Tax=Pseudomonas guariconensis TaxID=1288410 RepID=UPI0018A992D7|nr:neuraminidase-like domain-containing protein [Pseudomonas guariconensis]MBF8742022.1 hypothetical protein [Pseudomonas guariconensis]MBF8751479.1 hypothetical protein [Pseudomonas guariconensis]
MIQVNHDAQAALCAKAGINSLASAGLRSCAELQCLDNSLTSHDMRVLHKVATRTRDDAMLLEKKILTHASPLLPQAIKLGIKYPGVSLQDYQDWFGGRALKFAAPGDVASMFSPAAYLVTLYREAQKLYPEDNPWHIDVRRPDLKDLTLSQVNLDTPVSALSLSNTILMKRLDEAGETLEGLSAHVGYGVTPYHHHYNRLSQARRLKDPAFEHMEGAPHVSKHLGDASMAGLRHDISPALYALLVDEITDENVDAKFATYFPGTVPEEMLRPARLREWFGLTDKELMAFINGGVKIEDERKGPQTDVSELINNGGVIYQLGVGSASTAIHYAYLFFLGGDRWELSFSLKQAGAIEFILEDVHSLRLSPKMVDDTAFNPGKEYRYAFEWKGPSEYRSYASYTVKFESDTDRGRVLSARFATPKLSPAHFLLKLNKTIRLHKATGLDAQTLDSIIRSVDPTQISAQTLTVLSHAVRLAKRYAISHESALVMARQLIDVAAPAGQMSQFDRLFNDPPLIEGGLDPEAEYSMLDLDPSKASEHADIKATLKRACQTDDEGLYQLGRFLLVKPNDRWLFPTTVDYLSGLYTLSLWARSHGLAPVELTLLLETFGAPRELGQAPSDQWLALLERLTGLSSWLQKRGWTVQDLVLMSRDVNEIPASTEITNLIKEMQSAIANAELPEDPVTEDYLRVLTPLIASVFGLSGETTAQALLIWADRAAPGGLSLVELGEMLKLQEPVSDPAMAFAYGLAQMALIVHASGVTADLLALLVEQPHLLADEAVEGEASRATLKRSMDMVVALTDFSAWLKELPDAAGASGALLAALNAKGVSPALLAQATGQAERLIAQAAKQADWKGDVKDASSLVSAHEITVVRQWLDLAGAFGVQPDTVAAMLLPEQTWNDWRTLADAFEGGLDASQVKRAQVAVEAPLSSALAGVLAARMNFGVEQLNQHLLLDSLNGAQVMTSRIAEAMAALQMFIHRTLSEPEDKHALNTAALDRQFFRDWTRWNARYATWSAGQMLMYYPENYIDPTVRLGQTKAMDDMLQVLGQAQINGDTVSDAFHGYLSAFEEVANLETISGYYNGREEDAELGKTWFIGRSRGEPREYWWRTVDEGKRDQNSGALSANAWSGWTKIEMAPQVVGRLIRPVIYRGRLHLMWVERQEHILTRDDKGQPDKKEHVWSYKLAWLRYDGSWSAPLDYRMPKCYVEELEGLGDLEEPKEPKEPKAVDYEKYSLFLVNLPGLNALVAGIYDRSVGAGKQATEYGGIEIREDLHSKHINLLGDLQQVPHWLDSVTYTGLCRIFDRKDWPVAQGIEPKPGSSVPDGFVSFSLTGARVNVIDTSAEQAGSYSLRLDTTLSVEARLPEVPNPWITELVGEYESLATDNNTVRALARSKAGAFLVRQENGQDWGYICVSRQRLQELLPSWPGTFGKIFDVPLGQNEAGIITYRDTYIFSKFRIATVNYPLPHINVKLVYSIGLLNVEIKVAKLLDYVGEKSDRITPARYLNPPGKVGRAEIRRVVYHADEEKSVQESASTDFDLAVGLQQARFSSVLKVGQMTEWPNEEQASHVVTMEVGPAKRQWLVKVYKKTGSPATRAEWTAQVEEIATVKNAIIGETAEGAQYFKRGSWVTRLNTLFARQLTERAILGIDTILSYDTQQIPEPVIEGNDASPMMDFRGANALYFWELFYYTPMMVMQRFLQEERFDLAEQWLKYVFNPTGYTVDGVHTYRMWNVRPLEEDTSWNDEPLESLDPDAVAQNDPMHYKLNAFMRLLDITLGRGDAAYRKLERDTLSEAKVWYQRALRLLGDEPWIEPSTDWNDPSLGDAASQKALDDRMDALSMMADGVCADDVVRLRAVGKDRAEAGRTLFLPEANRMLLGYWEALRIRLYNLRHNLTLDGQPLSLPLYATPADPKALWADAVSAQAGNASALPKIDLVPALRFIPLMEGARTMASQLIQFGSTMQNILERQDAEALAELLNTQGVELATSSVKLQQQTLNELVAEREVLTASYASASLRHTHYHQLYEQDINTREHLALDMSTSSQTIRAAAKGLHMAASFADAVPNIFGLANGGGRWGATFNAMAIGTSLASDALDIASWRMGQEEAYRRRRQEWEIQYKSAEQEMKVIQAQLDALTVRETSANMQIAHMQTQSAHAQAQLALLRGKFTGKKMYSWLRARLASIFYTYYDLTASRCMMAQKALQWEMGDDTRYLRTGTWNGAWAGLLCGEGLMLALGQMENAWVKWQKRELEVSRTVSLAQLFEGRFEIADTVNPDLTLNDVIKLMLDKSQKVTVKDAELTKFEITDAKDLAIHFGLRELGLTKDFANRSCRVRSLAVSLPALLGPYQNVRARLRTDFRGLPLGCEEVAISHGMQDKGLFLPDAGDSHPRWGAQWLPFEGLRIVEDEDEDGKYRNTTMTLSFTDVLGEQKTLLQSLSDIVVHVQFTVR